MSIRKTIYKHEKHCRVAGFIIDNRTTCSRHVRTASIMTTMADMLYEADATARLAFVNWSLHSDHDEEIDYKISVFLQQWVSVSTHWIPQISG